MCGINGKISDKPELVSKEIIHRMNNEVIFRGPEAEGIEIFQDKNNFVGFGHRRLKIIDLSDSANQPFISPDKNIIIVFNGEIYNFLELKKEFFPNEQFRTKGDTEVVLKLYQKFGIELVHKLRGMFAIAIYDKNVGKLFLIRDHLGKKPLFYTQVNNSFIFASQLSSILTNPEISKEINLPAVDDFLSFNYIPGQQTIYKNIYKLQPGSYLEYAAGKYAVNRYWRPDFTKKTKLTEPEILAQTEGILQKAVDLRLISDVPLGAFLSGGVDSSLIVALMAKSSPKVKTFSIGFEQQDFSELKYAKLIAEKYNTEHTEFIVKPNAVEIIPDLLVAFDEPYADPSQIPMYYLAKLTKQKVTVALNGDGGDECFAGYDRYQGMFYQQYYRILPRFIRQIIQKSIKNLPENTAHSSLFRKFKWLNKISLEKNAQAYLEVYRSFGKELKQGLYTQKMLAALEQGQGDAEFLSYFNSASAHNLLDKMLNTDINTYLPQDLLVKADRSTMFHSLESRSPLLDYKLLEFSASIPAKIKMPNLKLKYLLKKIAEKYLPLENIYRKKQGFGVPLGSWFRNELKDYIQDIFEDSVLIKQELLNRNAVFHVIDDHLSGKRNNGRRLFSLLMLEHWFRKNYPS